MEKVGRIKEHVSEKGNTQNLDTSYGMMVRQTYGDFLLVKKSCDFTYIIKTAVPLFKINIH